MNVLVREAELVDSLENLTEGGLFVSQELAGQLLQDQRDVVQDHCVLKWKSYESISILRVDMKVFLKNV